MEFKFFVYSPSIGRYCVLFCLQYQCSLFSYTYHISDRENRIVFFFKTLGYLYKQNYNIWLIFPKWKTFNFPYAIKIIK